MVVYKKIFLIISNWTFLIDNYYKNDFADQSELSALPAGGGMVSKDVWYFCVGWKKTFCRI